MIVIIDDDKSRMNIICKIIALGGYDVVFIDSTDRAIEYLEDNWKNIDAIILDMFMQWGTHLSMEETGLGITTGEKLYFFLRQKYGYSKFIIIYTALNEIFLKKLHKENNTSVIYKSQPAYKIINQLGKYEIKPKKNSEGDIIYVD